MKLRFLPLTFPLFCLVLLWACTKSGDPAPTPTEGSIFGQIVPRNAATAVKATDANGRIFSAVPATDGYFEITGVPAGTYSLTFTTIAGIPPRSPQNVSVTAGNRTTVGVIQLKYGSIAGSISPAASAGSAQLVYSGGFSSSVSISGNTFRAENLPDGIYTLLFVPTASGGATVTRTFQITNGADLNLPVVDMNSAFTPGMRFRLGSTSTPVPNPTVTYSAGNFNLVAPAATQIVEVNVPTGTLTRPGTYSLTDANSYGKYTQSNTGAGSLTWATGNGSGGALIISDINTSTRKISGSFYFVGQPSSGGAPMMVDGIFNQLSY